jgi:large subunit ribosomal protein L22
MSPKKVRRMLGLIQGKKAEDAMALLRFRPSPAAEAVAKTVKSAVANAENNHLMAVADLRVVKAYADDGPRLKRHRPASRGRISPWLRRSCHITIEVEEEAARGGT